FTVSDGTASSTAATRGVTVTAVNDAPVVTTTSGNASFTENGAAVAVDGSLTLSDVDNTTISGATVQITGNYANGQDTLSFTNQNGITGSWDDTTGTLTLTGTATVAQYQAALRSITYSNSSESPSTSGRTISFTVNDGAATSTAATRGITVIAVNDAPVLSGANNLTTINEDAVNNSGTQVSALLSGQVSDVDSGAASGIAITGLSSGNGTWQYSTNGATWTDIGSG